MTVPRAACTSHCAAAPSPDRAPPACQAVPPHQSQYGEFVPDTSLWCPPIGSVFGFMPPLLVYCLCPAWGTVQRQRRDSPYLSGLRCRLRNHLAECCCAGQECPNARLKWNGSKNEIPAQCRNGQSHSSVSFSPLRIESSAATSPPPVRPAPLRAAHYPVAATLVPYRRSTSPARSSSAAW